MMLQLLKFSYKNILRRCACSIEESKIYLSFRIYLLSAFLYLMPTPFTLIDDYGQAHAAEQNINSPAHRVDAGPSHIGDQNWYIFYNYLRRKVYTQILDFNEIKTASPYAEEQRILSFVLMPDDLVGVEILPRAPITKETGAYFVLYQLPQWRETLFFESNVISDGNSVHIFNIIPCRMGNATLIWRNWGSKAVVPATRIILRVWRQTAERGQIGDSLNLSQEKESDKSHGQL